MSKPFKGVVNIDVRDSVPDWEPYEQPKAPEAGSRRPARPDRRARRASVLGRRGRRHRRLCRPAQGARDPTDDLKELAAEMEPNTSAILAVIEDTDAEELIDDMKGYTTNVVTLTVGDEVSGEIAEAVAAKATANA